MKNIIKTLILSSLLVVSSTALASCNEQTKNNLLNVTCFLKIDGIEGEVKEKYHRNWISVDNYKVDYAIPEICLGYSNPIIFTKKVDRTTPKMAQSVYNGQILKRSELEVYNSSNLLISKYIFETMRLVSDEIIDNLETFSFVCSKITTKVERYDENGNHINTMEKTIDYSQIN